MYEGLTRATYTSVSTQAPRDLKASTSPPPDSLPGFSSGNPMNTGWSVCSPTYIKQRYQSQVCKA
jgi:hypothetical protein